ncbi:Nucleolar protein 16 [Zalerion maritima]|uniref:Nucleolar protein 16 n=1 Tax=Zalerion maritima TaxID=339359 RepID=A0AAD5WXM9_9PEZI|nr:Nucleolar protein 16 [Zalerion maritima]
MGRDLQKRKRRSSRPVIRQPNKTKLRNPLGNSTIAKNWNKNETMTQNYRRLGLMARLKAPTGGTEKFRSEEGTATAAKSSKKKAPFEIISTEKSVITEAVVERDENGNIISVKSVGGKKRRNASNPLDDPLNDLDTDSEADAMEEDDEEWGGIKDEDEESTEVVKKLEEEASQVAPPKPRGQSSREQEWIERLVEKHGNNTAAMVRDRRLNPMQQTQSDIVRRLKKWKINNRMIRPGVDV